MNNLETLVAVWCRVGWLLLLIFTLSVMVVIALRKPCRNWFGAERAFLLWLLPPLAMLASLLPHAATPTTRLPPIVFVITTLSGSLPLADVGVGIGNWRSWGAAFWLAGAVGVLLLAVYAQSRYRAKLRGAVRYDTAASRWLILRAVDSCTGPALVGAWRPLIALPADFDSRYNGAERALIIAHETMHARRHDGWCCLLAQLVTTLFWFHPLAWWALRALRHDQELACDAAVLRENGGQRRCYANAMLKTLSATFPLPVGCAWSPSHPLTERIAMLNQPHPNRIRSRNGIAMAFVVTLIGTGCAYAAATPAVPSVTSHVGAVASEYQLALKASVVDGKQVRQLAVTMCQAPGKSMRVSSQTITVDATVTPLQHNRIRIDAKLLDGAGHRILAQPVLTGVLGEPLDISGQSASIYSGAANGSTRYILKVTPLAGCPARTAAARKSV